MTRSNPSYTYDELRKIRNQADAYDAARKRDAEALKFYLMSGSGFGLDERVRHAYSDFYNGGNKWVDTAAPWIAERPTWRNTSSTYITTPQKKAFSLPAVREPTVRAEMILETVPVQPKKLMLAGDWHGNLPWAFKAINFAKMNGADTILHVGDFGWWGVGNPKTVQYLAEVDRELKHCGIRLYWVDGNHEDHAFWHQYNGPKSHPVCAMSSSSITHLPRGYRWEWWGDTWMALGGAHSVDRSFAVEGESWWPGEWITDDQLEYAKRPGNVDIIVAHDAPSCVDIPGIVPGRELWLVIDGKRRRVPRGDMIKAQDHRRRIQEVCDAVKPVEFYHGHYHRAYNALGRIAGGGYVNVRGLDKDGTTMEKNTHFITEGTKDSDDDDFDDDLAW